MEGFRWRVIYNLVPRPAVLLVDEGQIEVMFDEVGDCSS